LVGDLPGYVETSPSGNGVHAIGYGRSFKTLGSNGSGIEAYASKRYFTVTGTQARGYPVCTGDFVEMKLALRHSSIFHRDTESQETQETQETQDSQDLLSQMQEKGGCVVSYASSQELPSHCRPTAAGQRNRVLFALARHLKARFPGTKAQDHLDLLKDWHRSHLSIIKTQSWWETWADFRYAWMKAKTVEGEGLLESVFKQIDPVKPIPEELLQRGYDQQVFCVLECCRLLALRQDADGKFFLGGRSLAKLFKLSQPTANKLLLVLVDDGVLELIDKGGLRRGQGPVASVYRYQGPT